MLRSLAQRSIRTEHLYRQCESISLALPNPLFVELFGERFLDRPTVAFRVEDHLDDLGIAAALVVLVVGFLGWRALSSLPSEVEVPEDAGRTERTAVDLAQDDATGIEYDGYVYTTRESGGQYSFVRTTEDGSEPLELFKLEGTPVSIVLYDGAFVVSENTAAGWDVMAYMLGDGSVASALVGADGNPVAGEGALVSATLDGDDLVLETQDGTTLSVPLA